MNETKMAGFSEMTNDEAQEVFGGFGFLRRVICFKLSIIARLFGHRSRCRRRKHGGYGGEQPS
jgi:hypothetical protein